jgi:hypothetical protein
MPGKKVQLNCWVDPDVKKALERQAMKERRRPGNLGGFILEWAERQLQSAGNSLVLAEWEAQPRSQSTEVPAVIDEKSYRAKLKRQVLTDAEWDSLLEKTETAQTEKVGRGKGHRAHSKSASESKESQADRDRTSSG